MGVCFVAECREMFGVRIDERDAEHVVTNDLYRETVDMSENTVSLSQLEKLVSKVDSEGLNFMFGAGVSRDAPTNGPIWSEMQIGFLQAVFDRMEADGWPAASHFPAHREIVNKLAIRPELFWREMHDIVGREVVTAALGAAGADRPNENHARVAALLKSQRCKWAITTNFDEHLEAILSDAVQVAVPTEDLVVSDFNLSTYLKLHGSIGAGHTLSYTLEHYDNLESRHARMLEDVVSDRPLVIAGYSGYDTDILPTLRKLADRIPWIVVVRHPGSPGDQPVLQLASVGVRSYVLESASIKALNVMTYGVENHVPVLGDESSGRTKASCYAEAVKGIGMHLCPAAMTATFKLCGHWGLVRHYAWLTHDALCDDRYRPSISDREYQRLHHMLALCLKLAGSSSGAQIMLNEAKTSLDKGSGSLSDARNHMTAEAYTRDALSQAGADDQHSIRTSLPGFKPSEIIASQLELTQRLGGVRKGKDVFLSNWQIGVTRRREKDYPGSIAAFNEAVEFVVENTSELSYLERGHFFLDFGSALFEHGLALEDDEVAKQATTILMVCEKCTRESGDWCTNAKAHLMIAKLYAGGGSFAAAWESIAAATEAVNKTKDTPLAGRINQFADILRQIQQSAGEQGSV